MRVYEEARGCYLRTKLCGLFPLFFAEDPKEELFRKICPFLHRNLDPRFDWGLALNPIAFIALSRKVYYILTNSSPPFGYDTREMAAPKKKKGEDVKKERERES